MGCDPFCIDYGFIRRDVEMQVLLMDPAEGAQVGTKRLPGPFTGGAVHLTSAISIIIRRPLVHAVADGGMERMATPIALPRVGREQRAARWDVLRDQCRAGTGVCMVADPEPVLAHVPRDHTDDGWGIVGIGPMPAPFIGAPPGRIGGVRMRRACFPPRRGTARRPRRPCQS
jgi:hypothetical protein